MRRHSLAGFAAALLAVASVAVPALPATATPDSAPGSLAGSPAGSSTGSSTGNPTGRPDVTAPWVTALPTKFVLGARIDAAGPPTADCYQGTLPWNFDIPLQLRWRGGDSSGVAGYDVWAYGQSYEGAAEVVHGTLERSFRYAGGNYDGSNCGGGNPYSSTYWVVARDSQGNSTATKQDTAAEWVYVWQEDGTAPDQGRAAVRAARTGRWTTAKSVRANGGQTLFSTAAGSSLTYRFTTVRPGQTVGLVMSQGPRHGRARITVDGRRAGAAATRAPAARNRVVVWQRTLGVGRHTVRVTNAGTRGGSRVDVDSLLLVR